MGVANGLRVLWNHLGLTLLLSATSEAVGFPASNLETGNRNRFWKATTSAEQTLTWDAGAGFTISCDTVVLPRADLLVASAANVSIQYSPDLSAWTDAFPPLTPIQSTVLAPPGLTDYVKEFPSATKRGWRVRLYGTLSAPASLAGGIFLGQRTELPSSPMFGRSLGVSRTHRGLDLEASWPTMDRRNAKTIKEMIAAVTGDAAEGMVETVAGTVYGGLPHYLWDPVGRTLSEASSPGPTLVPVLCLTPNAAVSSSLTPAMELAPQTVRWRERR